MRIALVLVALAGFAAGAAGCGGTRLRVVGYPQADVYVVMPGGKDYTYVGRTAGTNEMVFEYELPAQLENTKLPVLVKTSLGAWKYTVFTDRDQTVHYPPEGAVAASAAARDAPKKTADATATATSGGAAPAAPPPPPPPPGLSPADEPPSAELAPD